MAKEDIYVDRVKNLDVFMIFIRFRVFILIFCLTIIYYSLKNKIVIYVYLIEKNINIQCMYSI
jgi:type IV secretory pathway TrbL component